MFSRLQIGLLPSLRSLCHQKEAAKYHFSGNKHYEEVTHSVNATSSSSHNKHKSFAFTLPIFREVIEARANTALLSTLFSLAWAAGI
jgi:hypothetical protein